MYELWKPTHDIGYEVSSFGRIRSVERVVIYSDGRNYNYQSKVLALRLDSNGYLSINFSRRGRYSVHRLVADAFCPGRCAKCNEVNHIDGVKTNNHYLNLEWCTSSYNKKHALENKLRVPAPIVNPSNVEKIRSLIDLGFTGVSIASYFGISTATVSNIKNFKGVYK